MRSWSKGKTHTRIKAVTKTPQSTAVKVIKWMLRGYYFFFFFKLTLHVEGAFYRNCGNTHITKRWAYRETTIIQSKEVSLCSNQYMIRFRHTLKINNTTGRSISLLVEIRWTVTNYQNKNASKEFSWVTNCKECVRNKFSSMTVDSELRRSEDRDEKIITRLEVTQNLT